jgi:hypothetical protein
LILGLWLCVFLLAPGKKTATAAALPLCRGWIKVTGQPIENIELEALSSLEGFLSPS